VAIILAAPDESFRQHIHQRLLQAGCEDIRLADTVLDIASLLRNSRDAQVVLGGRWPQLRPLLHTAVRAGAAAMLILQSEEGAREALQLGATAVLHADISESALKAAVAASQGGLIVFDSALETRRELLNSDELSRRAGRQLTQRERKILSLVAGGVSNKGIARSLGVSANTVKFHLAAAFEKLNVATRAEAVAEAIRRGELSV
jgi:DNA-binding NarL/FixJ family response regulator